MTNYRLYYIQDMRLKGADEIEASDDSEAFAMADERADGHLQVEVWKAGRKIHVSPRTGSAAAPG